MRPKWLSVADWEAYVLLLTEGLMDDPRWRPAYKALGRALLDTYPTDMSSDEAFRIMAATT